MEEDNPLKDLVREESFDRKYVAESLQGVLELRDKDGALTFLGSLDKLSTKQQIIIYLLGKKVQEDLGYSDKAQASPSEIAEELGLNHNTVRSVLSRGDVVIHKDKKSSEYLVPDYKVESAVEKIK